MYELLNWAAKVVPRLPRAVRRGLAVLIGSFVWAIACRRRANVTSNVERVLGPINCASPVGRIRTQSMVCRIFRNCMHNYLELFALPGLKRQELIGELRVAGVEYLNEALAHGRGVVLFSAHLGPFECLPSWFSAHGFELVIPVENVEDKRMLQLMLDARRCNGVDFVPVDGVASMRTMFEALRRNQLVLITADRAIAGKSAVMDFFGAAARLPWGPIELSLRTGAPLVGAFGWRTRGGGMAGTFTRLTLALPQEQRANPTLLAAAIARQLELVIGDHLDQWVVFEQIWADSATRVVESG